MNIKMVLGFLEEDDKDSEEVGFLFEGDDLIDGEIVHIISLKRFSDEKVAEFDDGKCVYDETETFDIGETWEYVERMDKLARFFECNDIDEIVSV